MQFQTTKKETLSISTYFCKMKELANSLILVGSFVFDEDFILQLLSGLPLEYDAIIASINSSSTTMTIEEVQSLLLNQEMRIKHSTSSELSSAHVADKTKKPDTHNNGYDNATTFNNRGGHNFCGRGRGRGRGWHNNNRPYCQLCGKLDHVAIKCFRRFDQTLTATNNNTSALFAGPDSTANT